MSDDKERHDKPDKRPPERPHHDDDPREPTRPPEHRPVG